MNFDQTQKLDGSMAKSPEVCGGVVMEREKSMMKKSMNSMLRVALVGVMALVFGVAGFVSNAEAVSATYYEMLDSGTSIGAWGPTDGGTGCTLGASYPAVGYKAFLSATSTDLCATSYRYNNVTGGPYSESVLPTPYGSATTVTGTTYTYTARDSGTHGFQLFALDSGGVEVSTGTVTNHNSTAGGTRTVYEVDISAQSVSVPVGGYLGLRITAPDTARVYVGEDYNLAGVFGGTMVVDEVAGASCTANNPTVNISTAPATITSDGGSAVYNYSVTNNDTAACADRAFALANIDSAVTNFDASNLSAATTGNLAPGAVYNGTLTTNATAGQATGSVTSTITASQGGDSGNDAVITSLNVVPPITPIWGACQVTNGRQAYANGSGSMTATVSIADTSQAFLLVDIAGGALETNTEDHMSTGYIANGTTLQFNRVGTAGPNAWVSWQLVECFNNEFGVQRGEINLGGAGSGTAGITAVSTADSIVLVSSRNDNASASQVGARVIGDLQDGSTVRITRQDATGNEWARYEVVTFNNGSGVNVQTGTFAFDSTASASQTQAISAVDPTRTWLYASWDADTNGLSQDTVGLELTNATTITAYREAAVAATNDIRYYLVEFPAGEVTVQRGAFDEAAVDPNAGDNAEGAVPITITTPVSAINKAFTNTTNTTQGTGTAFARNSWLERLTATDTITISNWRTNNTNSLGMHYWQVMEFTGSVCSETATVALDAVTDPITGNVTISATLGGSGGSNVEVSDDNATWQASPWSYNPPAAAEGSVTFYAQADGFCGKVSDPAPVTVSYDTLVPSVTSTVPTNGATAVAMDSNVTINFSENIDCATVDTSSVTILPAPTTWNRTSCSGSTAVFAPTGQANLTPYTVTVDAADLAGNNMAGSYIFTYTTDCTDSIASSIAFNGVTTAAGDFAAASMVVPVDLTNLEYRVTEGSAGTPITVGHTATGTCSTGTDNSNIIYIDNMNAADGTGTLDTISAGVFSAGDLVFFTAACTEPLPGNCVVNDVTPVLTAVVGQNTWTGLSLSINVGERLGFSSHGYPTQLCRDTAGINAQWDQPAGTPPVDAPANGITYTTAASGTNSSPQMVASGSTGGGETTLFDWNADLQLGMSGEAPSNAALTHLNTYTLYARGVDAECGINTSYVGGGALPGTGKDFIWSSCTEGNTLALNTGIIPATITGATTIEVTGASDAGTMTVGTSASPTNGSPWTYNPPQDNISTVTFHAQGDSSCTGADGLNITAGPYNINTMAAPVITAFVIPPSVIDVSAAPYDIPITTLTATDNSGGAIQYMVTTTGVQDGTWGAAPANVSVPAYGPYTLSVWARDASGNISTVSTDSTTISDCVETGSVSLSALPNPITGTYSVVATTASGASVPQVSVDGVSYSNSPYSYTPPVQSNGTQQFWASATGGNCGSTIYDTNNPTTANYDTRTDNLVVLPASAVQQGLNGVTITMPYLGDKAVPATFRYQYQEDGGGYTAWSAYVTDADGLSPKTFSVGGLTLDALIDINVQYADTGLNLNGNSNPQALQVQLIGWVDNDLLHNSLRFACDKIGYSTQALCIGAGGTWDETLKWATGWGTTTGEYGPIMCGTCHAKKSGNIKRIQSAIPGSFPGSAGAVIANNASTDYGADNTTHGTSQNVCEVCHSVTAVHNYDMPAAVTHNGNDCISCHEHKKGFRASCSACHGNPPVDAGSLVFKPGATTGSSNTDGWGAHATHVTTEAFTCDTCHGTSFGTGASHSTDGTGSITIEFNAYGSTAGNYDGQNAVGAINGYDGASAGTVDNTRTCDTVYCHGGTLSGTSPVWTDTSAACGSCHANTAGTVSALPSGTSHNTHANAQGLACTDCHGANGAGPSGHLDGEVSWSVGGLPGSSPTYRSSAIGQTGAVAPDTGNYGTCSNIACHNNVATPTWNSGPASCTTCHAAPPLTNAHAAHYSAKGWSTPDTAGANCDKCHPDNTAGHSNVTDGTIVVAATGITWNSGPKTCSTSATGCHNGTTTPAWTSSGITCTNCHSVGGTNSATVANPVTGLHNMTAGGVEKHDNNITGGCEACHTKTSIGGHWDGTASAATPSFTSAQVGITAMTGGNYTDAGGTATSRGTCATTCHADNGNWARQWSTAADSTATAVGNTRCDVCHGQWTTWAVGTTHYKAGGSNSASNGRGSGHDCANCHAYVGDALHDNTAINVNNNGAVPGRNGTYPTGTAGCGICHGAATDGTKNFPISYFSATYVNGGAVTGPACNSCHDSAVAVSKGAPAVDSTSGSHIDADKGATFTSGTCEDCHVGHWSMDTADTRTANKVGIPTITGRTVNVGADTGTLVPTLSKQYATHDSYILLGGTATDVNAWYSDPANPTAAEMCWGCHDSYSNGVSEWGVNNKAATNSSPYNYGNVTDSDWTAATWSSSRSQYAYKTGAIQSTHTANDDVSDAALGGANYAKTETKNAAADIRCTYCHDVHNVGGVASASPYLRGTWRGNPYEEDGAPRRSYANTTYFADLSSWGEVPRADTTQRYIGGYWIDQNNVVPMSAGAGTNGTAALNPTTGFTLVNMAGLCTTCHGSDVDNMDEKTGENLWLGINGHANSVIGGSGNSSTNDFNVFDARGGTSWVNEEPTQHYANYNGGDAGPAETTNGTGFRSNNNNALQYDPLLMAGDTRPELWSVDEWAVNESGGTLENQYHSFSCSKCHNPHASRLPKLMITNCLDTKHNTWDNQFQMAITGTNTGSGSYQTEMANWQSAQNCHRYAANNPNTGNSQEELNSTTGTNPQSGVGAGWNKVTPWTSTTNTE